MNQSQQKELTMLPLLQLIESDHEYRILACRVPDNGVYVEKLLLLVMPNETDGRNQAIGHLLVDAEPFNPEGDMIDWIEVDPAHRRKGIARRLWRAAEKVLGRQLVHNPVTDDGEAFTDAMEKEGSI